ncbi:MAG: winged helix DNA-binding protein [Spirochaetales bacterium]|nr:winged helix DNA-binding protein [Spirochaetales bacterium]
MNNEYTDKEYVILENIYHRNEKLRQRELSQNTGISLGMTNMIVKRLVKKGMLVASKINSKNIHYAVTPDGINEIMKRSYRYFRRTMDNIALYKIKIEELIRSIKEKGYQRICLIGKSDLDFIIEYFCNLSRLKLEKNEKDGKIPVEKRADTFYVYSENLITPIQDQSAFVIALYEWLK